MLYEPALSYIGRETTAQVLGGLRATLTRSLFNVYDMCSLSSTFINYYSLHENKVAMTTNQLPAAENEFKIKPAYSENSYGDSKDETQ